jgi:hypothetical protein
MGGPVTYTRVLKGKYRIARNVYATCRLDVLSADDQEMRLFLGLKQRGDTAAAVGTRIFLDATPLNQPPERSEPSGAAPSELVCLSVTVREVRETEGRPLLVCSGIQRETLTDRRSEPRRPADFPLRLADGSAAFRVTEGNVHGLTLEAAEPEKGRDQAAGKPLLSLMVDRGYDFTVTHKETDYRLSGAIKHIHYDWKRYRHRLGVALSDLSDDQEIVLNRLLDPDYTVPISNRQTIDTSQGKISPD